MYEWNRDKGCYFKDEFRDDFKNVEKKRKGEKIFSDMHSKLIQSLRVDGNFENFSTNYFIYFRYILYHIFILYIFEDCWIYKWNRSKERKNPINPIFGNWREFREFFQIILYIFKNTNYTIVECMNEIEMKGGGKNSINPIFGGWREFREFFHKLFYIFSRIQIIRSLNVWMK